MTAPTKVPAKVPAVISMIDQRAADFAAVLPRHIPSNQFVRIIKTAINGNPDLLDCPPAELFQECQKAAADGLVLDGREAVLNIYNSKRKVKVDGAWQDKWVKTPKYIPMYQGLIKRARNSGEVKAISAYLVYQREIEETNPTTGRPWFYRKFDERGEVIEYEPMIGGDKGPVALVFSMARMAGGAIDYCVMEIEEVRTIMSRTRSRKRVKAKNGEDTTEIVGPWKTDTGEMIKKTCIRRHHKTLPFDSSLVRVFARDDDLYDPGADAPPMRTVTPVKDAGVGASRLNGDDGENPAPPDADEQENAAPEKKPAKKEVEAKAAATADNEQPPFDGDVI